MDSLNTTFPSSESQVHPSSHCFLRFPIPSPPRADVWSPLFGRDIHDVVFGLPGDEDTQFISHSLSDKTGTSTQNLNSVDWTFNLNQTTLRQTPHNQPHPSRYQGDSPTGPSMPLGPAYGYHIGNDPSIARNEPLTSVSPPSNCMLLPASTGGPPVTANGISQ